MAKKEVVKNEAQAAGVKSSGLSGSEQTQAVAAEAVAESLSELKVKPFADSIGKFEELMSQKNRAFLLGAGCSKCAGLPLTFELTEAVLADKTVSTKSQNILAELKSLFKDSKTATIEDFMSELVDLLAIATRRDSHGVKNASIELGTKKFGLVEFENALSEIKESIARCIEARKLKVEVHKTFVNAVHGLRVGKGGSKTAVDYFVMNYDTLIEDSLAMARLPYTDGFQGGPTGWWDEALYERDGVEARVVKLHGSIDWCRLTSGELPRRIRSGNGLSTVVPHERSLIWPASTKYRETQKDPYAQMLTIFRSALRGPECVLTICGYRFADAHINIEIEQALKESKENLTLLVFTESDQPEGQLNSWLMDSRLGKQLLVFAKRGFFHGQEKYVSEADLPWWKFEVLTRILAGER